MRRRSPLEAVANRPWFERPERVLGPTARAFIPRAIGTCGACARRYRFDTRAEPVSRGPLAKDFQHLAARYGSSNGFFRHDLRGSAWYEEELAFVPGTLARLRGCALNASRFGGWPESLAPTPETSSDIDGVAVGRSIDDCQNFLPAGERAFLEIEASESRLGLVGLLPDTEFEEWKRPVNTLSNRRDGRRSGGALLLAPLEHWNPLRLPHRRRRHRASKSSRRSRNSHRFRRSLARSAPATANESPGQTPAALSHEKAPRALAFGPAG